MKILIIVIGLMISINISAQSEKPYFCGQTYDTPTIKINKVKSCNKVLIKKGEEKISVTKFTLRIPTSNNPNDYKELVAEGDEFTTQMKKEIDKMEIGDQLMIYQITSNRVVGGLSFKIIK